MKFLLSLFIVCLTAIPSQAGYLFGYPRDGHFKVLPLHNDPWYYIDHNNWNVTAPDKWQHYMGNYIASRYMKDKIGVYKTISIMTAVNALKEIEDGYREGLSYRDFAIGSLGMIAGVFDSNLMCEYDSQVIKVKYYIVF